MSSDIRPADNYMFTLTHSTAIGDSATTYTTELPSLPDFASASDRVFTWGFMDSQSFCDALNSAYRETVCKLFWFTFW